jgi:hypothetical protein
MASKFTAGKKAIAECDRCGQRYYLKQLAALVIRTKSTNILVCPTCWEPDHPQNMQGMYPVQDPQAIQNPRRDNTYRVSGITAINTIGGGSRVIEWGWNPVGMPDNGLTPNTLIARGQVGTVTVVTNT